MFLDEMQFQAYDPDSTCSHNWSSHPSVANHPNDLFSLGLICLQLMRLQDVLQIYDFDNFTLDYSLLSEYISQLNNQKVYSQFLLDLLTNMLHKKDYHKYTLQQVTSHIQTNSLAQLTKIHILDHNQPHQSHYIPNNHHSS